MDKLTEIVAALQACKGTGRWARIAQHAGCSYSTLARLARGASANPRLAMAREIVAAIAATKGKK